eukprot:gnl/TRDRNA2_/TRDRNA2_109088_c1_seq1.p1 gnl/TRDRNA2_/TRDRNA2_109088_c1~~gnl/TRDRNA2_/TRDRNA2_109088_c1_seq1.p1  ORF type:complete len:103 (-),score=11.21 gnl/TRDRNA2_/TRDRNA2_109088_c1_seq1:77-385(-)
MSTTSKKFKFQVPDGSMMEDEQFLAMVLRIQKHYRACAARRACKALKAASIKNLVDTLRLRPVWRPQAGKNNRVKSLASTAAILAGTADYSHFDERAVEEAQ